MKVLVVDDDPAVRDTVRSVFEADPDWVVAGEAADGREAIRLAEELQPDAVVLDLLMPAMSGIDALPAIVKAAPAAKVVMLTAYPGARELLVAAALGASCTIEKAALVTLPRLLNDLVGTPG